MEFISKVIKRDPKNLYILTFLYKLTYFDLLIKIDQKWTNLIKKRLKIYQKLIKIAIDDTNLLSDFELDQYGQSKSDGLESVSLMIWFWKPYLPKLILVCTLHTLLHYFARKKLQSRTLIERMLRVKCSKKLNAEFNPKN